MFLLIILNGRIRVDLHEEEGKENNQTLANLSPAEQATSKDEVEIDKFFAIAEIQKHSIHGRNFVSHRKSVEQFKTKWH